ncbi:MAG: hypothetical protein ACPGYX_02580 [Oceanobacter sp.]
MLEAMVGSVALLFVALDLLIRNRPATNRAEGASQSNWPGAPAARFAAGLIAFTYAAISLVHWQITPMADALLLMQQVSLYAALPTLVSTHLAERLQINWSRQIWGRIFLGWCVVFELARRNDALTLVLLSAIAIGIFALWIAIVPIPGLKVNRDALKGMTNNQRLWQIGIPLVTWIALIMDAQTELSQYKAPLWLATALVVWTMSQQVSYHLAIKYDSDTKPDADKNQETGDSQ